MGTTPRGRLHSATNAASNFFSASRPSNALASSVLQTHRNDCRIPKKAKEYSYNREKTRQNCVQQGKEPQAKLCNGIRGRSGTHLITRVLLLPIMHYVLFKSATERTETTAKHRRNSNGKLWGVGRVFEASVQLWATAPPKHSTPDTRCKVGSMDTRLISPRFPFASLYNDNTCVVQLKKHPKHSCTHTTCG